VTRRHCIAGVLAIFLLPGCAEVTERRKMRAADAAAQRWLAMVDAGEYSAAWQEAAPPFKARSTVEQWINTAASPRPPGAVSERRRAMQQYLTTFGGTQGEYVNLAYTVSAAGGNSFGELITVMMAPDGQWRVYGYRVVGVKNVSDREHGLRTWKHERS
jgi:hypothetical protein